MLFLFNSAARPEYVKNVLNTLNFPSGAVNEYQYSETNGKYNYVENSANLRIQKQKRLIGTEVLISYMDRDQDPFKFFPLRKGILSKIEQSQGRIYYHVKLSDYAFTESIDKFNDEMNACFSDSLYKETTDESGKITQKGFFAFIKDDTICEGVINRITVGNDKWRETVEQIENCKKFKEDNNCVFTKFSIKRGDKMLTPISKGKAWHYKLLPRKEYTAIVDYRFVNPSMRDELSNPSAVQCTLEADGESFQIRNNEQEPGAAQSHLDFPLVAKRLGRNDVRQRFFFVKNSEESITYAQKPMYFRTRINALRIGLLFFLVLLLFMSSVVSGLKTDTVISRYEELKLVGSLNCYQEVILFFARLADKYCEIVPAITAAVTTGCTALIAILLGKKE